MEGVAVVARRAADHLIGCQLCIASPGLWPVPRASLANDAVTGATRHRSIKYRVLRTYHVKTRAGASARLSLLGATIQVRHLI
jgi:hypothetical protein